MKPTAIPPRRQDQTAAELAAVKTLLGKIRDEAFGSDAETAFSAIRALLLNNWSAATPHGKAFDLVRHVDRSNVSGTGRVAEGFEFENGKVALCWTGRYSSVNVYDDIGHVHHIHGHGGSTEVVYK